MRGMMCLLDFGLVSQHANRNIDKAAPNCSRHGAVSPDAGLWRGGIFFLRHRALRFVNFAHFFCMASLKTAENST
jgi:hypothetical protein